MDYAEFTAALNEHEMLDSNRARIHRIREAAKVFGAAIYREAEDSAERTLALRDVQRAAMWAETSVRMIRQEGLFQ